MATAPPPRHIVLPVRKMASDATSGRPTTRAAAMSSGSAQSKGWMSSEAAPWAWARLSGLMGSEERMLVMALPPQHGALGDVHGADVAVQVDQDGEADGGLGGGEGDAEEGQHEAVRVPAGVGEGDEVDVRGVEDELRGDEDAQG